MDTKDIKYFFNVVMLNIRLVLFISLTATLASLVFFILEKPKYYADARLLIKSVSDVQWFSQMAPLVQESWTNASSIFETEFRLMKSKEVIDKVIIDVNTALPSAKIGREDVLQLVKLNKEANTNLVHLIAVTEKPELSYRLVDAYTKYILKQNASIYRDTSEKTKSIIEKQLAESEERLNKYRQIINSNKNASSLLSAGAESTFAKRGDSLKGDLASLRSELLIANQIKVNLQDELENGGGFYAKHVDSSLLKGLIDKKQSLYTQMKANPQDKYISEQYNVVNQQFKKELRAISLKGGNLLTGYYEDLLKKIKNQEDKIDEIKNKINIYSKELRDYGISNKYAVENYDILQAKKLYDMESEYNVALLKKLQEANLAEEINVGNVKLVSAPQMPQGGYYSGRKAKVLFVFMTSFLFSLVLVVIKNYLENTINIYDDIVRLEKLCEPLGFLPTRRNIEKANINNYPANSYFVEAYKTVLIKILINNASNKITCTMPVDISVANPTVTVNLAINESKSGMKVLVVDANLRSPTLGKLNKEPEREGLLEMFEGEKTFKEVTRKTEHENLFFIYVGNGKRSPIDTMLSAYFNDLIAKAQYEFDSIFIMLPPANVYAEGWIMAMKSRNIVLLIEQGVSKVSSYKETLSVLERYGVNILGSVFVGYRSPFDIKRIQYEKSMSKFSKLFFYWVESASKYLVKKKIFLLFGLLFVILLGVGLAILLSIGMWIE